MNKVICINNNNTSFGPRVSSFLTIGKVYNVSIERSNDEDYFIIKDDIGVSGLFRKYRFKLLSDVREDKLKELGI